MNMESNKLLAALLVAGIVAMLAGFFSHKIYAPQKLAENVLKVDVTATASSSTGAAAPTTAEPIEDLMAAADPAHGEKVAKVCAACHSFNAGGPNKVGPNLHGIVGAKHAHVAGFAYSDAMKSAGGNWDRDALNQFLWNPKKAVPGTKMAFAGLKKAEDRAALIKWLETLK